jgi:hypothetical protein
MDITLSKGISLTGGISATAGFLLEVGVYDDTALVKVWDGVLTLAQIQTQYAAYKIRFGY